MVSNSVYTPILYLYYNHLPMTTDGLVGGNRQLSQVNEILNNDIATSNEIQRPKKDSYLGYGRWLLVFENPRACWRFGLLIRYFSLRRVEAQSLPLDELGVDFERVDEYKSRSQPWRR